MSKFETLKNKNMELPFFRVTDKEFAQYGRVLNIDLSEMLAIAEQIEKPEKGITYVASLDELEDSKTFSWLKEECFGQIPIQVGYCAGQSNKMNAMEWHNCNEINVGVTSAVLLLAHYNDLNDGKLDSSKVKAFYLERGQVVEVYAMTLHYCPCQTDKNGFCTIVALPEGTNLSLDKPINNRLLCAKNKWLIAHVENETKIKQGAVAGITGKNLEILF